MADDVDVGVRRHGATIASTAPITRPAFEDEAGIRLFRIRPDRNLRSRSDGADELIAARTLGDAEVFLARDRSGQQVAVKEPTCGSAAKRRPFASGRKN